MLSYIRLLGSKLLFFSYVSVTKKQKGEDMVKRAVFLEDSGSLGMFHHAVKVDEDWYEIERVDGYNKRKGNSINGDHHGKPKRRGLNEHGKLICAGSTHKTDREILDFNEAWIRNNPRYNASAENCQKYAMDFVRYLVGGSFNLDIPLTSVNAWAGGPGSHSVSTDGYNEAKATTGKAGAQFTIGAVEVEGPAAGAAANWDPDSGNAFVGADASLFRAEAQLAGVGARLEPNLNTGVGWKGGHVQAKVAGFGLSVGKGFGIHTPLGSLGWGKF